ncbi:hypothetical protein BDV40DRAFT_296381 [Aspergillus tamarii]|uniref:Uncharacterized protein n=1 Tax=Aspergillus tamarii TaxID=41984 RepID=A0A5N6V6U7_ASPTM|nr:hypothetical protein BDV40DRAFT_296381 [Aspergillus tamarii]
MIRTSIIKAFSLRGILFAATGDCGQILNAVWSSSSFSTIGGRGGNHHGSSEGFALLKEDGGQAFPIQLPEGADCQPGVTGIKATLNPQPMRGGDSAEYDPIGGIPWEKRSYATETEEKMTES